MLSATLATAITQITQSVICHSAPVGGGDISQAARLTLDDGRLLLVKYRQPSINGMFTAEANGLALLRASQTLRIPQLWGYAEAVPPCPAFILMEWLGRGPSTPVIATELGRGLAAMHATPSPQPSPKGRGGVLMFPLALWVRAGVRAHFMALTMTTSLGRTRSLITHVIIGWIFFVSNGWVIKWSWRGSGAIYRPSGVNL